MNELRKILPWLVSAFIASCALDFDDRTSNPTVRCEGGTCECVSPFANCDGNWDNGCEVDLTVDRDHCGACDTRCEAGGCEEGICACPDGWLDCDGDGICDTDGNTETDNCGGCGVVCFAGGCDDGMCACPDGWLDCDEDGVCEVEGNTDNDNCGSCGARCNNGACSNGTCECNAGAASCNGLDADGCETILGTDPDHCGACDHACGGGTCVNSTCQGAPLGGEISPTDMTLHGNRLYFVECFSPGSIGYVDTLGDPMLLSHAPQCPLAVAVSDTHAYWIEFNFSKTLIVRLNLTTMDLDLPFFEASFTSLPGAPLWDLEVYDGRVYWAYIANDEQGIRSIRADDGGDFVQEWSISGPTDFPQEDVAGTNTLTKIGDHFFYHAYQETTAGTTYKLDLTFTVVDTYTRSGPAVSGDFAVNADRLYVGAKAAGAVHSLPHNDVAPTFTALTNVGKVVSMALDDSWVYYVEEDSSQILRVPLIGMDEQPEQIAQNASRHLNVSDEALFWVSGAPFFRLYRQVK